MSNFMKFDRLLLKKFFTHRVIPFIISQWFFIGLGIFVVLAYLFPNFARHGGTIKAEYTIGYGALGINFLVSGLSMSTKLLFVSITNWRAHIVILFITFGVTSSIMYSICYGIKVSNSRNVDEWVLIGLVLTSSCPPTLTSSVVMTRRAGGNDLLTLFEVFIGNILGAFVTPALTKLYTSWGPLKYGDPAAGSSIIIIYKSVLKHIGLAVFVPLFVGQVLQNMFPKQVTIFLDKTHLRKTGQLWMLLIMWSSFSTAFYQKAFQSVTHICIVFVCLFNIGIYLFFTIICFICARPWVIKVLLSKEPDISSTKIYNWCYKNFRPFYYSKKDTISLVFCAPSKTASLGVSLITSQYGNEFPHLGKLLIPLVLYQTEQIVVGNCLIEWFKKWSEDTDLDEVSDLKNIEHISSHEITEKNPDEDSVNTKGSKIIIC